MPLQLLKCVQKNSLFYIFTNFLTHLFDIFTQIYDCQHLVLKVVGPKKLATSNFVNNQLVLNRFGQFRIWPQQIWHRKIFGPYFGGQYPFGPYFIDPHLFGPYLNGPHPFGPYFGGQYPFGPYFNDPHPFGPYLMANDLISGMLTLYLVC